MRSQKDIQLEKGHGRIEKKIYYYSNDVEWMPQKKVWKNLGGIGMVIRENREKHKRRQILYKQYH